MDLLIPRMRNPGTLSSINFIRLVNSPFVSKHANRPAKYPAIAPAKVPSVANRACFIAFLLFRREMPTKKYVVGIGRKVASATMIINSTHGLHPEFAY